MNSELFDSATYTALRKPLLQASTLPSECYTDAGFYRREIEQIFRRHWQFVGRVEQLVENGDYLCYEGPAGPVILLRDRAGELRRIA